MVLPREKKKTTMLTTVKTVLLALRKTPGHTCLIVIVDKWRKLNEQVEYAAQRDRVEKHILLSLKRKVRNMEDDVADACYCINPEDQRLVHSDSTTNP